MSFGDGEMSQAFIIKDGFSAKCSQQTCRIEFKLFYLKSEKKRRKKRTSEKNHREKIFTFVVVVVGELVAFNSA